ncbi:class I SAM-dependent methyltransferase [Ochrovirga pacifica]|uniref:class I SAM-dependent methyltransferase n=1 Tax=Ochrovirga pacifica TaxID=1042376 RepID=UPI000255A831|nr:class I SAM-dependent methyltransferase [Ochrovirga pacifica]
MEEFKTWFSEWFNTHYYHILYKNRNQQEARDFIENLVAFLKIPKSKTLLDLACGKGRHSIFLNSLGYKVIGADLSKNSIEYANQFANKDLSFVVQDMREPFLFSVDAVFNMFTSFGYFDDDAEDIKVLQNIANSLPDDGIAVIDYMNVNKVIENLVSNEVVTRDELQFHIRRKVKQGFIIKEIDLTDQGEEYHFMERVKAINLEKFTKYCQQANLTIQHTFGNYQLDPFNLQTSDRLILILSK